VCVCVCVRVCVCICVCVCVCLCLCAWVWKVRLAIAIDWCSVASFRNTETWDQAELHTRDAGHKVQRYLMMTAM
jgi:hypothetical protein